MKREREEAARSLVPFLAPMGEVRPAALVLETDRMVREQQKRAMERLLDWLHEHGYTIEKALNYEGLNLDALLDADE